MGELNLLPIEIKDIHKKRKSRIFAGMVAFAIIASMIVAMLIPKIIIASLESKESKLKMEVDSKRSITEENTKLKNKIKDYTSYFSLIDAISANDQKVAFRLKQLSEQLPADVTITALTLDTEGMTITGVSKNYTAICNLAANLETSKKYKMVQLTEITSDNAAAPQYTCTIKIVR